MANGRMTNKATNEHAEETARSRCQRMAEGIKTCESSRHDNVSRSGLARHQVLKRHVRAKREQNLTKT